MVIFLIWKFLIYVNGFRFLFCFWFFFSFFVSGLSQRPVNPGLCPRLCFEGSGGVSAEGLDLVRLAPCGSAGIRVRTAFFFLKKTGLASFFIQPIWHTWVYEIINIKIKIKNK